jgi:nucleotide-binding universal stress UspA family protein
MYKRILVAVDETDSAARAAREATALAQGSGALLRFINVTDDPTRASRTLALIVEIARRARVEAECGFVPDGASDVATAIRAEAARWRADLIVVGSHGRQGLARLLFGSVSESVGSASDVPVLIVHAVSQGVTAG